MRVFSGQQKVISTYLQKRSIFLNVCSRKDINKIKQKQNKQTTKKSRCFITPLSVKRWKYNTNLINLTLLTFIS